eukprot:CAMPEP_0198268338 /NCGR_PEP_ID=MMETSP1447-20131203/36756_1 /TAXON_ID=420782 /ORGANISM="Chaetoceros dichaeta, Strain CCMP1751" /LENGTH=166 /DNA_ID=CAMNT_0043959323 /DNA_START=1 /DNA_END=501 /DNA_ORIENTATION=-
MMTEIISQAGKYYADGRHLLQNQNEETETVSTTDDSSMASRIRSKGGSDETLLNEMLGIYSPNPHDESMICEAIEVEDFSHDLISLKTAASSESNGSHKSAQQVLLPRSDKKCDEQSYEWDTSNALVEWCPTLDGDQSVKKSKPKKGMKKKLTSVFRRFRKPNIKE